MVFFIGHRADFLLPDRSKYVDMEKRFLHSYMDLLVQTCHRRGALATGGMAALLLPRDKESELYKTVLGTVTRQDASRSNKSCGDLNSTHNYIQNIVADTFESQYYSGTVVDNIIETSHNTTKLAQHNENKPQHNEISPMHCVVEISLCCALLGHFTIWHKT